MTLLPRLPRPVVDARWLEAHIDHDQLVVVDSRWYLDGRSGRAAYEGGHVPGAMFADLDADLSGPAGPAGRHPLPEPGHFAAAMGRLGVGDGHQVVAYDDVGGMVAGRLWWMLDSLGESAAVLDGGIDEWPGALEKGSGPPRRSRSFTARPWPPERFATGDDVAALATSSDLVVLDARSADRFRGEENEMDPRFGHIPGARNAPWADNLSGGRLRRATELSAHYRRLGVGRASDAVAYCGSGVSACLDLLAMSHAGLGHGRLYVGSWSEWGADPARPVVSGDG